MAPFWFGLTLAMAVTETLSRWRDWKWPHYIAKPGTLLALTIWSWQVSHWQDGMLWFGLGLIFSLAGDILLMLPERFFLPGVGSFMGAQVLYILGLRSVYATLQPFYLLVFAVLCTAVFLYLRVILRALSGKSSGKKMRTPIMLYGVVIGGMLFSAILTLFQPSWPLYASGLVAFGALSFFFSDSLLGYNRFVTHVPYAELWIISTYLIGQIAITAGAFLYFCG